MGWLAKVARTDEPASGRAQLSEIEGRRLVLFNLSGAGYAIDDVRPHRDGPLLGEDLEGDVATYPWYGARFRILMGEVRSPSARHRVLSRARAR